MTRIETLRALLILKQPGLLDKLTVELNGAHYTYRCVRTEAGVTVRFGQLLNDRDLGELLPRVAEAAVACLLDEARAALLKEAMLVRTQLTLARNMARELGFRMDSLKSVAGMLPDWSTDYLAAQYLLGRMAQREPVLAARLAEIGSIIDPDRGEEDADS